MYWRDLLSDSSPPVVPHFASEVYVSHLPPPSQNGDAQNPGLLIGNQRLADNSLAN